MATSVGTPVVEILPCVIGECDGTHRGANPHLHRVAGPVGAQHLVKQVAENGRSRLEGGGVQVGQIVGNNREGLFLGIETGKRCGKRSTCFSS